MAFLAPLLDLELSLLLVMMLRIPNTREPGDRNDFPRKPCNLKIDFNLEAQIIEAQKEDKGMKYLKEKISNRAPTDFKVNDAGVIWFKNRLVVPKVLELHQ